MKLLALVSVCFLSLTALTAEAKEKVVGIGGFFFRAENPQKLSKWYLDHFGIELPPSKYDDTPWKQEAGVTIFATFEKNDTYFDTKKVWMINFRVKNLDAMVAQLRAAGIHVDVDPTHAPNGRFAHLQDPEGNPIELWEPESPSKK